MGKEFEKPKEELAPAYFVQYSALWCIMLAFFVLLLTLGTSQSGGNKAGVGEIRDAFGATGGLGLMAFAKNAFGATDSGRSSLRIVRHEDAGPAYDLEGVFRGLLSSKGLASLPLWVIEEDASSPKVYICLPIEFWRDNRPSPESVDMLEKLAAVIFHLDGYEFDCMMHLEGDGDSFELQKRAMIRSVTVVRFLAETCGLPPESFRAVGYYDKRFMEAHGIENVTGKVLLSIKRPSASGQVKE